MDENTTKEAISILYDMEIHNYKMTRAIQRLNYEISCLGKKRSIKIPQKPMYRELPQEENGLFSLFIGIIVGVILDIKILVQSLESGSSGWFWFSLFGIVLMPCVCGSLAYLIEFKIRAAQRKEKEVQLHQKAWDSYNEAMAQYSKAVARDEMRVEKELCQKKILEAQRSELVERRQKAEQVLAMFYMKIGIDKNYRSLIPISKMHEIVSLGITTKFYGENGLNDRVRKELREDAFYVKLDEISQKLDTIISKTDRLYGEILNLNSQCENLISATMQSAQIAANNNALLSEAVKNTEIAAYNSERIATEQRYQSLMMTWKF